MFFSSSQTLGCSDQQGSQRKGGSYIKEVYILGVSGESFITASPVWEGSLQLDPELTIVHNHEPQPLLPLLETEIST